ncbi:ryanodine receptor [Galendromus occidentalis]|uniref:Ryanodine receptor n=1 Tax=Galendromus occidentalis TaxID=34638 RepID=A0AAJ7SIU4_9ACAR|nr:ryanodine receptor [Galendromus occidentalis]
MAEGPEGASSEQDDLSFLRTDDMVCLQCTATGTRVCLAAEGFGNRHCYLENIADKDLPPAMLSCVFVIEQALSVRALQEMVTATNSGESSTSTQSGHRTLLYGHAVLLRHQSSNMYLACLSSSSSNDKLAFDVGLQNHSEGEACWWTIHPASKQRSEGEKVRVGDDLILVSVATERYLHTAKEGENTIVNASFHLTHWPVAPFGTGASRTKNVGYVFGGEVIRFYHSGDECLTIPQNWTEEPGQNIVVYEGGAVLNQARSLWRLELVRTKWAGAFINWENPLRIHHITTGQYLSFNEDKEVCLVPPEKATLSSTAFWLRKDKDDKKVQIDEKDEEVLGFPLVKYGDTTFFIQHQETSLWLSYKTYETKKRGVGKVEEKQVIMSEEGKMDDGLEFSRAQVEEARTARVIRKCGSLFTKFIKSLDAMATMGAKALESFDQEEMNLCFEDLINYFAQPEDDIEHEEKQAKLKALRNRQDLFQEEGILNLTLDTIDKINAITTGNFAVAGGSEAAIQDLLAGEGGPNWEEISGYLYQLLACIIKGNHTNCAQFAQPHRLDWLFGRLGSQQASEGTGMLDVLHCVLIDSPEALNIMKADHIKVIISLLEKHGRDPKVLDVLCSLCVTGNGIAVRSSQNNICDNLLPGRDLLLQTKLVDHVSSMRPNIYVCKIENSAMFRRWYFEAQVDYQETISHLEPYLRIGWASTAGYVPYPGGGSKWGGNGVGDDLFSYGFDGRSLWTGGRANEVLAVEESPLIKRGDVIGCILDLNVPVISFTVNGRKVKGCFRDFNLEGLFYPVISLSAKVSCRFLLGGDQGRLRYGPPEGYSALCEVLLPRQALTVEPCFMFGDLFKGIYQGPTAEPSVEDVAFVPEPVETATVVLPAFIEQVRDKLAENIHEVWSMRKVDEGWCWGEEKDDDEWLHPCLVPFSRLPMAEKRYDILLALNTLKTVVALGYHVSMDTPPGRIRTVKLHNDPYMQPNGYKPAPLDLSQVTLSSKMDALVELLAENTHNVWSRERIQQGWTYGIIEDFQTRRSPHLVPYKYVDDSIKKANTDTAAETVKTLLAYGYVLEPPAGDTDQQVQSRDAALAKLNSRTLRAEKTYAVTSGKWYFEFEVSTPGPMKVGWATVNFLPSCELGGDENSFAYDGLLGLKNSAGGSEAYGRQWAVGDVIGCMLDLHDKTISFSLNGELLLDALGGEAAFSEIPGDIGYVPAFTLGIGQRARLVWGHDVNLLQYFTTCGLQEGYQPFCVNMNRQLSMWYNKDDPIFINFDEAEVSNVEVTRVPPAGEAPPAMKITHKLFESVEKVNYEFLRLSLPIQCHEEFIDASAKERQWEEMQHRQKQHHEVMFHADPRTQQSVRPPGNLEQHMLQSGFSMSDVKDLQRAYSEDAPEGAGSDSPVLPKGPPPRRKSIRSGALTKASSFDHTAGGLLTPGFDTKGVDSDQSMIPSLSELELRAKGQDPHDKKARGKSPFKFFSRNKDIPTMEPAPPVSLSPPPTVTIREPSIRGHSPGSVAGSNGGQLQVPGGVSRQGSTRRQSMAHGPIPHEEGGAGLDPKCLEYCHEYFYGCRIFPGQDPQHVYVGWITTAYKYFDKVFDLQKIRKVAYHGFGDDGSVREILDRRNSYMVCAGQLLHDVQNASGDGASRGATNQGMYVGCHIDVSTGFLTFTADGKPTKTRFKMEPGTKLFPAVFFEATTKEVFQFELGRTPSTLPLSAALLRTTAKSLQPLCPPRLRVQCLQPFSWARVPNFNLRPHALRLSEIRGWSIIVEDHVSMLAVHIPEEDRCIDVLELIEHDRLANFHAGSLALYEALCYQGNQRAAHIICNHVDEKQLMYAIKSAYMSGPLRCGFTNLLIALHLEFHAYSMSLTQTEFIIPLGSTLKDFYEDSSVAHSFQTLQCISIRPQLTFSDVSATVDSIKDLHTPTFPHDALRQFVMEGLADAVRKDSKPNRDPIGGSNENLFVPLLKLADKLLVTGLLDDADLAWMLKLLDPVVFGEVEEPDREITEVPPIGEVIKKVGLIDMHVAEGVQLQLCHILHHLLDLQLRHRIESIINFSDQFTGDIQADQLRRYIEIKQSDLPSSIAAKKTREFRCKPIEQMRTVLNFKNLDEEAGDDCPCGEEIRSALRDLHDELIFRLKKCIAEEEAASEDAEGESKAGSATVAQKLLGIVKFVKSTTQDEEPEAEPEPEKAVLNEELFIKKVAKTVVGWAQRKEIENREVIRQMFNLLLRIYNAVGELIKSLEKTYIISEKSHSDVISLFGNLTKIRALLPVQMSPEEEEIMRVSSWSLVRNRIFFQHPDLIRILSVHENVMDVMVNTLGKRAQTQQPTAAAVTEGEKHEEKDTSHEMVVSCCRFLCYFCRTGRVNQKAMFDHLDFLLENSNILLSRPSLRGSTPLDVAYSSLMENSELALALREHYLEKIAIYLSRCGLQSNQELVDKGYPDVGWDPVEGERYLDFLRFCVWVNGESVEENANLVIRLLIRRPECLGPALRGEGPGLLEAIKEAIRMSEEIAVTREQQGLPVRPTEEEDEDYIDMGAAILNFYCALVDLLGRCAPDAATIAQGKNECIRARAILRSLVPLDDLIGALSLRFTLRTPRRNKDGQLVSDLPAGLHPKHKQSIALFLERVYGVETQEIFYRILENGFLPDLRSATMLERDDNIQSDMALALNRYIGNSVLPMLIQYSHFYRDAENFDSLQDAVLQTVYRLSKVKILTKGQREMVSDFLVALTREMQPSMLLKLLRKLTVDVSQLTEYTAVALRLLMLHYERCNKYYSCGQGSYGIASEEERRLTMILFSNIFDSLSKMEYDPELFSKSLPCLTAIACALPPDYSLTESTEDDWDRSKPTIYTPTPLDTYNVHLSEDLQNIVQRFSEHYHEQWAVRKAEQGWQYGERFCDELRAHPRLKPYNLLQEWEKERYKEPIRDLLKAVLAIGWRLEPGDQPRSTGPIFHNCINPLEYAPSPVDLSSLTLTKDQMVLMERIAENTHDIWAFGVKRQLDSIGGEINPQFVPYDFLTDQEKYKTRDRAQDLLKFLQYEGYRIANKDKRRPDEEGLGTTKQEVRFATSLLEKLIQYLDAAAMHMKLLRPSLPFSRRSSFRQHSKDVKFFNKVVLPLIDRLFVAHRQFFLQAATATSIVGTATVREKEMVAKLFCKLAGLFRSKFVVFGSETKLTVSCLQVLCRATDARTVAKSCPDLVKTSILTYFNNVADDLDNTVKNLETGRYTHLRGTHLKTSTSLNYIQVSVIPVLTALFDHLASNEFGADLLLEDVQVACYRILNAIYMLGTRQDLHKGKSFVRAEMDRHRPAYGNCLGAFAACFPVAFLEPAYNKFNPHCIHSKQQEHSLEAQAVMAQLESSMPNIDDLIANVDKFVMSNTRYVDQPHIIEVIVPMLSAYLPLWWSQGPDNVPPSAQGHHVTMVTSEHLNKAVRSILNLLKRTVAVHDSPWMITIAAHAGQIVINASEELLGDTVLPLTERIFGVMDTLFKKEESMRAFLKSSAEDTSEIENQLQEEYALLTRDIYAFYPLLIKYIDLQRNHWLKQNNKMAETLYNLIAHMFNMWNKSQYFRREEANFISTYEIDNMALIMPYSAATKGRPIMQSMGSSGSSEGSQASKKEKKKKKRDAKRDKEKEVAASLMVACLKRILPIGLNLFAGREQELVQHTKEKFLNKENDEAIREYVNVQLTLPDKIDPTDAMSWQHYLYSKLGNKNELDEEQALVQATANKKEKEIVVTQEMLVDRIIDMAKVLYGLHVIDHPQSSSKDVYRSVVSTQRKRAVIACFREVSLHQLPRHRCINLLLSIYKAMWLEEENAGHEKLIEDLTTTFEEAEKGQETSSSANQESEEPRNDPLSQLVLTFSRAATTEHSGAIGQDDLYMLYAYIFSQSCGGAEEEEEEGDEAEEPSLQEQELEKQKLLFQQARLADRGVAENALLYISACKGHQSDMVLKTLKLGISLLKGGNADVQTRMLNHLKDKKDVGFFTSIAALMNSCGVLNLDAFERNQKAEGLGVGAQGSAAEKNMHDSEFTCALFRFLQLLCEGHNLDFQNYLRTQQGNTVTVNIVISTVDYLLRLQESIMDFFWYYSSKELVDAPGKENFCKAITVAKQVFNSLTEFIQGPCSLNQQALAHSRLWDAVGGFLFLFANMQSKLSKSASQLDLLLEFLDLLKEMVTMMLSMLEGNVMNGTIGKQMVDTLAESSTNVELILKFFDMFLKLQELTGSSSFQEMDPKNSGWIAYSDFKKAMEQQKIYEPEEIDFMMACMEANLDNMVDYREFSDRFLGPSKEIGFNLAVLLTNLSEHMPNEPRLAKMCEGCSTLMKFFEPFMGRIEIMGSANRIERVYFEVAEEVKNQWEKPQIVESKKAFFYSIVTEGGDKEKLELFINFCEDAIFEMQHAATIANEEEEEPPTKAEEYVYAGGEEERPTGFVPLVRGGLRSLWLQLLSLLSFLTPGNLKAQLAKTKQKPPAEIAVGVVKGILYGGVYSVWLVYFFIKSICGFIMRLMSGKPILASQEDEEGKAAVKLNKFGMPIVSATPGPPAIEAPAAIPSITGTPPPESSLSADELKAVEAAPEALTSPEGNKDDVKGSQINVAQPSESGPPATSLEPPKDIVETKRPSVIQQELQKQQIDAMMSTQPTIIGDAKAEDEGGRGNAAKFQLANVRQKVVSFLARNFYTMKYVALALAFLINTVLLFYKVTTVEDDDMDGSGEMIKRSMFPDDDDDDDSSEGSGSLLSNITDALLGSGEEGSGSSEEEEELEEYVIMGDFLRGYHAEPALRAMALIHSLISICMMIAHYNLKVPLAIFKREKDVARALEFEGLYISQEPPDEDLKARWDRLVISTPSFPVNYWDKFVKKRVKQKYSETFDVEHLSKLLGIRKGKSEEESSGILSFINVDWRYTIWQAGVTITDQAFLYNTWYLTFSLLGNINYFFFAGHLIDVAVCIPSLKTILQSVTHNGKQLILTVMLLTIVVYMYTVIAFTFFRKFYVQEEDDEVTQKCHSMATCFVFHLYKGVRAGGGIGDEIEAPDGDDYEVYRIIFDITFFFFVIVILLAIIQGLIIDAFGELRDQLQSVVDDMESNCFICGIGKDYFDSVPHGFDTHVAKEHNLANYMFFLMHLINKPDTEYTGQETYVWEMYQRRCWDFFPVGDCFRKQYEDVEGNG